MLLKVGSLYRPDTILRVEMWTSMQREPWVGNWFTNYDEAINTLLVLGLVVIRPVTLEQ
jgi:hypothetical protein